MVVTRRVGNNLQLFFSQDDSQHPDIVLEDYYDNENVHLIGLGENGQFYEYVPTSGDVAEYPPALTEGQSGEQVLGGEGYASADPLTASHNNFGWLPFMLLGGAAGGVAIGASGRGSSGHDSSAESVSVTLDPVADSDNDGRPEFSGTSNSPDSQVVIQLPDGTQITTQTDSEGNWYVEAPTSQPNGTVTVTVTDSAGNSGSLTEEFTDTSSPEAAVINSNDDEQISGKAEPGSTVVISDGSTGETTTVVVDENGDWSIQPNPVNEGDTDVTIVVVDPAGNVSPPSNGSRPDITPPDNINSGIVSDSVTLTDDVGAITGEIASGSVTDDARPTLSGDATTDIDHVNIYDNGELVGSAAVDADGKWSWTPEQDMADGTSHDLTVAAVDAAGNEGPQADGDWSFTVDTSTAAPEITNNTEDELAGNAEPGAVIVITDPVSDSVTSTVADADGHWSIQPNPAGVDTKDVVVEATDEAGNSNSVVIDGPGDSTPPDNQTSGLVIDSITLTDDVGAITGEIASGSVTDDARPTLSGDATADIDHVNIYDNGELVGSAAVDADGKWSWTPEQDMADGTSHDLTVAAVDAAGNEGPQADGDWSFTVDTSTAAPEITNNTEDELAGNAEPGAVIVITDPVSDSVTSTVADADGHWSIQPNPAGVDAKDVVVEATDEAGNSNSVVIDGPTDSTPPDNQTSGLVIDSITLTDDVGAITGEILDGSVTDDARPTFSGDATADIDHVNIYDNGQLIGSAAVDVDGKWSWTPEQDMADGTSHDLTVAAVDAAGNEGPQVSGTDDDGWSFTVDTTAPDIDAFTDSSITLTDDVGPVRGEIADGATTDDARPTYSGSVSTAGIAQGVVSVNIYDSGKLIGSAAVEADGKWSWTPDSAMSSGAHALTVAAVDAAGNEGPQVSGTADAAWDFSVLTSAPAQPAIENVVDDYSQGEDADSGFLQKGQFTNDGTLTLNGTAGAGLTVIVWATDADGNRVNAGSGVADDNGRWSITTAALGEDGRYDLTATAVNAAGVSSAETGAFNVVLDTVAPEAAVAALMDAQGEVQGEVASGGVTDDRAPVLKGTAEAGATVTVYLDDSSTPAGSTVADADGNWTLSLGTLTDRDYSWQVKVTDAAGNETRGERATFRLDSSSVELSIDQANDDAGSITGAVLNGGLTDDSTPELQGTAAAGAVVTISDQSGAVLGSSTANSSGVWTFAVAELADGEHVFTASVTNAAGNSSEAKFTLNVDTTPPEPVIIQSLQDDVGTLQFTSPVAGNVIDDPAPTFTGKAEKGSLVTLYDNGILLATVTADAQGEWSYTPTTNLLEGTHGITATATDAAGNVSEISSSWDFIIDITAPNVGISGNSEESLSGVTEPGVVVVIVDKNGTEYSVVADQQGKWVIAPNPISAGESGEIYAIDPAGNKGDTVAFQGSALATYSLLNESMQVNTTTTGDQLNPSTTRLADGRIVVTWQGAGVSGTEVYMQLFEADGIRKIGTEQQVNQRTANNQDSPQVIALTDGGFLIVYESNVNGLDNSGDGVMARRYG
ncbi:Ig-like domain-containing protein, partial [Pantoea agglomerans]|uniref:Ig-like domain-containing protein n=1 Tax=Enterobacter agglomerans TaxID=549 RepID=UPI00320A73D5